MSQTIKTACTFNPIIRDYKPNEGVKSFDDFLKNKDNAEYAKDFFAHNYMTGGMQTLFHECLLRLSGKSDQAVFELTQAMGGGKTHMMLALAWLAYAPEQRPYVLKPSLLERVDFDKANLALYTGRNSGGGGFVWQNIAAQLAHSPEKEKAIEPYYINGPKGVGAEVWKDIIGDKPTLILLDELPPYLEYACTQSYGQGTLADIVVYSLANLMTAAMELPRCAVVLANLSGSYKKPTDRLREAISNLSQETRRSAMTITPVELSGNEIYEILKKRFIQTLPDEPTITAIAKSYEAALEKAKRAGYITASTLENIADQIKETYPFHPSFKHIVALFKENETFRQTRGLMEFTARLFKSIDERKTDDVFLIGTQYLNLNDESVRDQITRIARTLDHPMTKDIADSGKSTAEIIDKELGGDFAQQIMALLLSSSLARVVGGRVGLSENELKEFLLTPEIAPEISSHISPCDGVQTALERLREKAWYLHREEQRYYIQNTENLSRRIERDAQELSSSKVDEIFRRELEKLLKPERKIAYQSLAILPKFEDLSLKKERTLLVVKPDGRMPPHALQNFFQQVIERNNLLVLTGEDSHLADTAEKRLREYYAIYELCHRLKEGDTNYQEAQDRLGEAKSRFFQALSLAYDRLYYPTKIIEDDGESAILSLEGEALAKIILDGGIKIGEGNRETAEEQIEKMLASSAANYKLYTEIKDECIALAERDLWHPHDRKMLWSALLAKAKNEVKFPWLPCLVGGVDGMECLKKKAIEKGKWRFDGNYIEKGPFPKEKATLNVQQEHQNPETGEVFLKITPISAGATPVIYYAPTPDVSEKSPVVEDYENWTTKEGTLYFLAVDSTGHFESAPPVCWKAEIDIRHQVEVRGEERYVTLQATPRAEIFYTLEGENPKNNGTPYTEPFPIDNKRRVLQVFARAGEANKQRNFEIPDRHDQRITLDETKPARFTRRISLDTQEKIAKVCDTFRDQKESFFCAPRIELGEGEETITVRFGRRHVTFEEIEQVSKALRDVFDPDRQARLLIESKEIRFETGHDLKKFAEIAEIELRPSEVEPDNV
ncbi:MAG: DUF499 domain-containing protein [Acetobacter sp.]|nr:DUF499 domain-containing protein [Acetobacter sp.]